MGTKAKDTRAWLWPPSMTVPTLFAATAVLQAANYEWLRRWLISGAPALSFLILVGEARGQRIAPFAHVWTLFATVNLAYAVASTSWLLYWAFAVLCYPTIYLTCLTQFDIVGDVTRRVMRTLIRQLHFIDDKISLFDIPALEIDTDVDGLMVFRGITFCLSSLSFVIHGVEVGIKLPDDLELAVQTETVSVSLFRSIQVGDCFANLKNANVGKGDGAASDCGPSLRSTSESVQMKYDLTDGSPPVDSSHRTATKDMKQFTLRDDAANEQYRRILKHINDTNTVHEAREYIKQLDKNADAALDDESALRAAICSELHSKPSVPHPPTRSIKVTTLQQLLPPRIRGFLHRLPMLLRLVLNPISYFHPVSISSITATASGRWIEELVVQSIFKGYDESDSELRRLKDRVSAWVADANFAVELGTVLGVAQVPIISSYSINCQLAVDDVRAYRALPDEVSLVQVVRLGGADATFVLPSYLLPHHEHLLPTERDSEGRLDAEEADVAHVKASVHAKLPAILDQELLDFVALLVKASKLVEIEEATAGDVPTLKEIPGALNQKVKEKFKKVIISTDQRLAKLVGRVMRKLEQVNGDLGYTGNIAVQLKEYRMTGWLEAEGEKLLP
ncbi:uncharacterized protein UV8b_05544 [Ustilaginoidea virens]|uniref:Uncharacterized protein n=1 Tax=Ustilaginoidea virens TaxID=1159556 RepID=A0A063BYE9_USTVR|nr:uncharacterized protein UV8b_05544 [Ustilaginoidea virens]QUC21301.1 hypothetical protein UV8b_05544 [Ustilaginoidea virens]GAO17316.1 hypothetical protein UVI_02044740 [Ustilaginoidea virens]